MRRRSWTAASAAALVLVASTLGTGPAMALDPPRPNPGAAPKDGDPSPAMEMRQDSGCGIGRWEGDDPKAVPESTRFFNPSELWKKTRGAGVTVAVIDTGVTPNPRLTPRPGGDYIVASGNGLDDCDPHGTVVASLIAGKPSSTDSFSGLAPEAQLISIRQSSRAWSGRVGLDGDQTKRTAGDLESLARAIVHAVSMGAKVINLSVTSCFDARKLVPQDALGGALDFAAKRDVVVVAAAGNTTDSNCGQNPNPEVTDKTGGWNNVKTVSAPSWFHELVISVGATDSRGAGLYGDRKEDYSLHGPWVTVAAPGGPVIGFGREGKLINRVMDDVTPKPIAGTSFSAAYVSGLVALIRSAEPKLTAAQVRERLTSTAHHPAGGRDTVVGYGVVDAAAALNGAPVAASVAPPTATREVLEVAPPPPPADHRALNVGWIVIVVGAVLIVAVQLLVSRRRKGSKS